MKFLINCSFGHYPSGTYRECSNFALIIEIKEYSEDIDMRPYIAQKLKQLNFNLGFKTESFGLGIDMIRNFTAQLI